MKILNSNKFNKAMHRIRYRGPVIFGVSDE